jgi:hypothetical protein
MITRDARKRMAGELFRQFKGRSEPGCSIIVLVLDKEGADVHTDLKPDNAAEALARCALHLRGEDADSGEVINAAE